MATKQDKPKKPKKTGMIKQIIQVFKFTYREDKALPWICGGLFVLPIIVGIILGICLHWGVFAWICWMLVAIMLGLLLFTFSLTRRADNVGYRQLEGRPGAAGSVLSNLKGSGFSFPQEPLWVDPRTQDVIWYGTSYNGIYLVGEGDYSRVNNAMNRLEKRIKNITAGSHIPVFRILVGDGPKQVRLRDLRRKVLGMKAYTPTEHKNGLAKKIHPRRRFMMTRPQLTTLNDRLRTLQLKSAMSAPKGMDPNHAPRVSRRAMRGR
ncbi:DUF4191 domain-containing protein [Bifidobacterium magnum]|uniref:DUF4191 domain-containing protein n=1 Tax=Bifidobacterium magnum TaxID=1692 RepID=A0A087BCW8_9BIFI|nr:DUF4191 domain-containing protein [Bifidobacterium magnum]KFI68868.1 hypothetical protein BMAGN_0746 [Bifidobacterium magnum]